MKILAIESSCDETAAAVVEGVPRDGVGVSDGKGLLDGDVRVLSNVVVSQVDIFAEYGGVIPEVAARSHLEAILPVIHQAMREAGGGERDSAGGDGCAGGAGGASGAGGAEGLTNDDIDYIAVTHTPGLLGSLLIGTLTARTLAVLWKKPLLAHSA